MAISNLHLLPVSLFILFPSTFLGTYIAAVLQGHVEPEFPYISDDATYSPESCVFGQLINTGSILLCLLVYIRYCEVVQFFEDYSISPRAIKLNKAGLWLGLLSSFGLSLVANFQETNVIYVHFAGALLCFGVGTIYFWVQAVLSSHLHPIAHSSAMVWFRYVLSAICTVLFFVILVTGIISHLQFHGSNPRKWHPEDGGWVLHVISTASEWVVAICFCLYILSFTSEFREITFTHPQIFLKMGRQPIPETETNEVLS
ncbi:DNA damage-regulated autophagy modulator protein 2 [Macrosteles quadrilineatus]|uniref:DNA damage-regulated autophagy modulator protein 2 n=1 Tax=Macrosteles quadrilineatus TaxID=74068 RepID=UPI0023E18BCB|nr:DNA damage-regulated autophagy modulator protein 2 [Macrosteles quadrilineatus]